MTDDRVMTPDRFAALARAYGGRLGRWPDAWRNAARVFASRPEGRAILAEADGVDALLDAYALAPPGGALIGRIVEAADRHRALRRRLRRWALGLGLVGVGVAGGLAGAVTMMAVMPGPEPRWATPAGTVTAFGDVRADPPAPQDTP